MKYYTSILISVISLLSSCDGQYKNTEKQYKKAKKTGVVQYKEITESSGITISSVSDEIMWVHNDQNNKPKLYAIGLDGALKTEVSLNYYDHKGNMNGDWEDISNYNKTLYIGDIGNNDLSRTEFKILLLNEPYMDVEKDIEIPFKIFRFKFPKGYVCNSEAMAIDPVRKKILIFSKKIKKDTKTVHKTHVWMLPLPLITDTLDGKKIVEAELILSSVPSLNIELQKISACDISADGHTFIVRNTASQKAYLWNLNNTLSYKEIFQKKPRTADLNKQKGGEAICFQRNQHNFITMYDMGKEKSPIHLYRLKKSKK